MLTSLLSGALWLRPLRIVRLAHSARNASGLERLAAVTSLYEQLGMFVEDLLSTFVSWTGAAASRDVLMADCLERLVWSPNSGSRPTRDLVATTAASFIGPSKRVRVDPAIWLESAVLLKADLLPAVGIPWRNTPYPSVRVVPSKDRPSWDALPEFAEFALGFLGSLSRDLLARSYNKIKHGPQLVIANIKDCAERRGLTPPKVGTGPHVRVLFSGARVMETPGEFSNENPVAPFLLDDPDDLENLAYRLAVIPATSTAPIAAWIAQVQGLPGLELLARSENDPAVSEMRSLLGKYLGKKLPTIH